VSLQQELVFYVSVIGFFAMLIGVFSIIAHKMAVDVKSAIYVSLPILLVNSGITTYIVNNTDTYGGEKGMLIFTIVFNVLVVILGWFISTRVPIYSEESQDIPTIVRVFLATAAIYFFAGSAPSVFSPKSSTDMFLQADSTATANEHYQLVLTVLIGGLVAMCIVFIFMYIFYFPNRRFITWTSLVFLTDVVSMSTAIGRSNDLEVNKNQVAPMVAISSVMFLWGLLCHFKMRQYQGYAAQN